jgi:hypothetical protein
MKYRTLVLATSIVLVVLGCSKSNEDDLDNNPGGNNPPPTTCVTTNMSYATNIAPIIQANCFGCHSNTSFPTSGAPFSLEGHANLVKKVNDGRLMGAINHEAGFKPMPQGSSKLAACDINKIKAWIDAGALNN